MGGRKVMNEGRTAGRTDGRKTDIDIDAEVEVEVEVEVNRDRDRGG
jgi:hypothetical protein